MSSISKSYLSFGQVGIEVSEGDSTSQQAIPASWYTSRDVFEVERRAVFSRKWLLTTHKLRLPNTGDYLQYDIAGFPFILCKDRKGNINAFHNVCRHRAFPVVTEQRGTARIFSCKYHGWSYGLNGKLAKAPGYQDLEGFDKSQNGLFPIHVHVDDNGFIWLNLDAAGQPEFAWEDQVRDHGLQSHLRDFNIEDYEFDQSWELEGAYNWKILAEVHAKYPASPLNETPDDGSVIDYAITTPEQLMNGLKKARVYCFPNASMTVFPHGFFIQRLVPTSPTSCAMRYEAYRRKPSRVKDFELAMQLYKQSESVDQEVCVCAQNNSEGDALVKEELPPFQTALQGLVISHLKRENKTGRQIWPSRQTLPSHATTSQDDIDFCAKLSTKSQTSSDCAAQASGCCGGGCTQADNEALAY